MGPSSNNALDDRIRAFLKNCPEDNYFDVGPGEGKFGKMIRELFGKKPRIVAVEPDKEVVKKCKLNEIYNHIEEKRAQDLIYRIPDFRTDIVIMGDILEHLKKSDGIDFLEFISYRCKYIILKFPSAYMQYAKKNPFDAHVSIWQPKDFHNNDYVPVVAEEEEKYTNLIILQGFFGGMEDMYMKCDKQHKDEKTWQNILNKVDVI